jgi:hypothetical protein
MKPKPIWWGHGSGLVPVCYQRTTLGGRDALTINLRNSNEATGVPETVTVTTALTASGDLFYMIAVSPESDAGTFAGAFRNVQRSVQLNN